MKLRTIIYPTDFSSASDGGLALATALARDSGARLLVTHVSEPPLAYGGGELYYGIPEPDDDEQRRMLGQLQPPDVNVSYEHRLLQGEPAAAIVELAEKEDADLIVMGTHGRTGLARLLMGSVAEVVVRRAPCPVLTYRSQAKLAALEEPARSASS